MEVQLLSRTICIFCMCELGDDSLEQVGRLNCSHLTPTNVTPSSWFGWFSYTPWTRAFQFPIAWEGSIWRNLSDVARKGCPWQRNWSSTCFNCFWCWTRPKIGNVYLLFCSVLFYYVTTPCVNHNNNVPVILSLSTKWKMN